MNKGKTFEKDFEASAKKVMDYTRLNDPASSFNIECNNCDKKKTRFAPRHLCDAIGYRYPNVYYFELKSVQGKSIPFKNIVKGPKDKRLEKMVAKGLIQGVKSFVILNFRSEGNGTYALRAETVLNYIKNEPRKSIPIDFAKQAGIEIKSKLKKVHYTYFIEEFVNPF